MILPFILTLAALTPAKGSPSNAPALPMLPHRVVAKQTLPEGDYLRCQLDGTGVDELVIVTSDHPTASSNTRVIVYRWRNQFVELGRVSLGSLQQFVDPAAGDLDGDGRDEIYVASPSGHLAVLSFGRGRLRARKEKISSPLQVTGITVASTPNGNALLAALGSDEFSQTPGVAVLERRGIAWIPSGSLRLKCEGMDFGSVPIMGDVSRNPLFVRHRPGGIDEITYSRLILSDTRLREAERVSGGPHPPRGMEWWVGITARLVPGASTVLSETSYLLANGETLRRGELLEWRRSKVVKRYRLPGAPLVSGDFRRKGEPTLLIKREGGSVQLLASTH